MSELLETVLLPLDALIPHPRNYRNHPDDQIAHLVASIETHGVYRPLVVCRSPSAPPSTPYTLLAGHGLVLALQRLGVVHATCVVLDLDPDSPSALHLLAADNEIAHLTEGDDRALSELLRDIKDSDIVSLLGTGYDDLMLANLVYVTRPATEVKSMVAAAEWVGVPDFESAERGISLTVRFMDETAKMEFAQLCGFAITDRTQSVWFPPRPDENVMKAIRFEA